jgi:hypothetical protein
MDCISMLVDWNKEENGSLLAFIFQSVKERDTFCDAFLVRKIRLFPA